MPAARSACVIGREALQERGKQAGIGQGGGGGYVATTPTYGLPSGGILECCACLCVSGAAEVIFVAFVEAQEKEELSGVMMVVVGAGVRICICFFFSTIFTKPLVVFLKLVLASEILPTVVVSWLCGWRTGVSFEESVGINTRTSSRL